IATTDKPLRAVLDPDGNILKVQKLPVRLGDLRDPSNGLMIVGTGEHRAFLMECARRDSVEMENIGWSVKIKPDSAITLGDLQGERVFLYGKASDNRVVNELQSKFPIGFQGDSVQIRPDILADARNAPDTTGADSSSGGRI